MRMFVVYLVFVVLVVVLGGEDLCFAQSCSRVFILIIFPVSDCDNSHCLLQNLIHVFGR